jgi:hypothetical protein
VELTEINNGEFKTGLQKIWNTYRKNNLIQQPPFWASWVGGITVSHQIFSILSRKWKGY